jgi:hypothetical protein
LPTTIQHSSQDLGLESFLYLIPYRDDSDF